MCNCYKYLANIDTDPKNRSRVVHTHHHQAKYGYSKKGVIRKIVTNVVVLLFSSRDTIQICLRQSFVGVEVEGYQICEGENFVWKLLKNEKIQKLNLEKIIQLQKLSVQNSIF